MKRNESLIDAVDFFFFEVLEIYRQLEKEAKNMTGFKNMFKPKNFLDMILQLKELKESAESSRITAAERKGCTPEELDLAENLDRCIDLLLELLDCKININKCLEQKLNGDKSGKKQYKELYAKAEQIKKQLNREIIRLDDDYEIYAG